MEKSQCCTDPQKMINKSYPIIDLFPSFQFVARYFTPNIYNSVYKHISDNNLLSPNQSGFRTGDSCINQLLSISFTVLTKEWKLGRFF